MSPSLLVPWYQTSFYCENSVTGSWAAGSEQVYKCLFWPSDQKCPFKTKSLPLNVESFFHLLLLSPKTAQSVCELELPEARNQAETQKIRYKIKETTNEVITFDATRCKSWAGIKWSSLINVNSFLPFLALGQCAAHLHEFKLQTFKIQFSQTVNKVKYIHKVYSFVENKFIS